MCPNPKKTEKYKKPNKNINFTHGLSFLKKIAKFIK